mgnify:CR=1 FL=1|tara:strand:+ start:1467 stop:1631 length:165 start_codon:yes stop_codon:yes gene_type:complete
MLNTKGVMDLLGVSKQTIYNYMDLENGLPYYKIGKTLRFKEDEVLKWVDGFKKQ